MERPDVVFCASQDKIINFLFFIMFFVDVLYDGEMIFQYPKIIENLERCVYLLLGNKLYVSFRSTLIFTNGGYNKIRLTI
jgi:hypothetical protein